MSDRKLRLSVLDQSPVQDGGSGPEALRRTVELAQAAEGWGYHRFWVAEHHNSEKFMGSSPEVMVSHLLAKTQRIRIGSGGVMLQHYSPYKVAENFNVLASLAPGRVDLGIGRGPGGLPRSTQALQEELAADRKPFEDKLAELRRWLEGDGRAPVEGVQASPKPGQPAEMFLLGTTASSGAMAGSLGIPYVFALFLNGDEKVMREAEETYRERFVPYGGREPEVMLALPVVVADTEEEAAELSSDIKMVRITLANGRQFTVGSVEGAKEFGRQIGEEVAVHVMEGNVVCGSVDTVGARLSSFQDEYGVEEIVAVTAVDTFRERRRSYELLSQLIRE